MGWDFLLLFFGGMFAAFMVTTMFRDVDPLMVDIAVFQMMMAFGGMIFGLIATMKRKGGIGVSVRPPTREDIEKTMPYMIGGFAVLAVVNRVIAMAGMSALLLATFNADMNIALTAAVAEEAVYSFGFTTFFFKLFDYITANIMGRNKMQENVAVGIATVAVSVLFFAIHIGVYGTVFYIAAMLFINRFIYALVYLKTRNLVCPTALHILHNAMTFI
jgi:membrane protease YdiL (CAAX protease family)